MSSSGYEVEVTIKSAKDLKNINWRQGKLNPYAVIWVDPNHKFSTRVDEEGDTCPVWNDTRVLPFETPLEDKTLFIDIVHFGATEAEATKTPIIGSAKLPLKDVVLETPDEKKLDLKRPSGRPHGKVEVKVTVRRRNYPTPIVCYATQPPYYSAPPPYGVPYGAPPAGYPTYGAPPNYGQPGYGQPSYGQQGYGQLGYVSGEEKKKSKFGGMGTGLAVGAVAGALGGLAIAEGLDALEDKVEDDVADDLGYDDGDFGGDDF